jgi:hypothetical protein
MPMGSIFILGLYVLFFGAFNETNSYLEAIDDHCSCAGKPDGYHLEVRDRTWKSDHECRGGYGRYVYCVRGQLAFPVDLKGKNWSFFYAGREPANFSEELVLLDDTVFYYDTKDRIRGVEVYEQGYARVGIEYMKDGNMVARANYKEHCNDLPDTYLLERWDRKGNITEWCFRPTDKGRYDHFLKCQ